MKLRVKDRLLIGTTYIVFGLLYLTYRFRWYGLEHEQNARAQSGRVCLSIWHRNSVAAMLSFARSKLAILVSQSFDGEVIASLAARFGIRSARGSSTRGGTDALRELIRLNKDGYDIGITVDGPTGPLYKVKPGILAIAARGGDPILPYAAVGRRTWVLHKSWDGFRIPKPFSEILCLYGQPISVGKRLDPEKFGELALTLEGRLLQLEEKLQHAIDNGTEPEAF